MLGYIPPFEVISTDVPIPKPKAAGRYYYGWVIVAIVALSGFVGSFQFNPTISVFMQPITQEFGWSRSIFASAVTVGTVLSGLVALVVGPIGDRFGAKWVLFIGFALMGALLIAMGRITELWQFYVLMALSRVLVQGVISISNNVIVAKWFYRLRGRAASIGMIGQNLGSSTVAVLAQMLVTGFGWRTSITVLGVLVWLMTLVPIFIWLRRHPSDMGLDVDGDRPVQRPAGSAPLKRQESFTLRAAMRMPVFYILVLAFSAGQFVNSGITFSMLSMLVEQGLSTGKAVAVLGIWGLMTVPGVLLTGLLRDKLPLRRILVGSFIGLAIGFVLFLFTRSVWMGVLFSIVHGFCFASILLLQNLTFADYYGPESLGSIRGFITPFYMLSNAIAPLAGSLIFDAAGSYFLVIVLYITLSGLMAVAMLFAAPPKQQAAAKS